MQAEKGASSQGVDRTHGGPSVERGTQPVHKKVGADLHGIRGQSVFNPSRYAPATAEIIVVKVEKLVLGFNAPVRSHQILESATDGPAGERAAVLGDTVERI